MRKTFEVLEGISRTSGSIKKLELLNTLKDNEFAKFYFETVFNKYLTYGVGDVDSVGVRYPLPTLNSLKELRQRLVNREITGNDARKELEDTVSTPNSLYNFN